MNRPIDDPTRSWMRLEVVLLGLFFACWLLGLLFWLRLIPVGSGLGLGLQGLFSLAAATGWLAGNFYVQRSGKLPVELRRRLLLIYLLGPPGLIFLLRTMAPSEMQLAAPLVPLYATVVCTIFFLVPVSLRGAFRSS